MVEARKKRVRWVRVSREIISESGIKDLETLLPVAL